MRLHEALATGRPIRRVMASAGQWLHPINYQATISPIRFTAHEIMADWEVKEEPKGCWLVWDSSMESFRGQTYLSESAAQLAADSFNYLGATPPSCTVHRVREIV